jgi:two-component system, NarL family, sensor histidine kinase DevS
VERIDQIQGLNDSQLQRLSAAGQTLVSELDLEGVLTQLLEAAKELTGARYAAVGVIDEAGEGLERFVASGMDEATREAIGSLPQGHGVLGELIRKPVPLRLADVSLHPRSYGFPAGHPPMRSFLGVPVMVRGKAFGNVYLTEKGGGKDFTVNDESLLVLLAQWAGIAIDNARLYERADTRRTELERAVRGLETTASLNRELGGETNLDWVIALLARRGRALISSGSMLVLLAQDDSLIVSEVAGELAGALQGLAIPLAGSVLGAAFSKGEVTRYSADGADPCVELGVPCTSVIVMPLGFRGKTEGLLVGLAPIDRAEFEADDELLLRAFAASAGTAVATARNVGHEKLSLSIDASEAERGRWARELHDDTLQELGALRLMQDASLKRGDPATANEMMERSVVQLDRTIASLQALITELRPASLDDLGVAPAIEHLVERLADRSEFTIDCDIDLRLEDETDVSRLEPGVESTIYRVIQEALNNVAKHAAAGRVTLTVHEADEKVEIVVIDDGCGFSPGTNPHRFGLVGMRERVALAGGELCVESSPGHGAAVTAVLPAIRGRAGASPNGYATTRSLSSE